MSDTAKLILSVLIRVALVIGLLTLIIGLLAGVNPVIAVARSVASFVIFALLSVLVAHLLSAGMTPQPDGAPADQSNQAAVAEDARPGHEPTEGRHTGALEGGQLLPAHSDSAAAS
jgi:hypothetical protein